MNDPISMHELYARDPRTHTDEDMMKIIEDLRGKRKNFVNDGVRVGAKKLTAKEEQVADVKLDITL